MYMQTLEHEEAYILCLMSLCLCVFGHKTHEKSMFKYGCAISLNLDKVTFFPYISYQLIVFYVLNSTHKNS
jgi:hypothetical protein